MVFDVPYAIGRFNTSKRVFETRREQDRRTKNCSQALDRPLSLVLVLLLGLAEFKRSLLGPSYMPIPRKLIVNAFALFETKALLEYAEHCGIKRASELPKEKLCSKLANRDNSHFLSCSWSFRRAELKKVAELFGIPTRGVKKEALFRAVFGFVDDYDKIAKGLSYESLFTDLDAVDFREKLRDWMDVRRNNLKFEDLTEGEQTLWWITFGFWEINGDGLSALFDHNSDDFPFRFIASLRRVGAKKSARAIESIGKKMFGGSIPNTMEERSRRFAFANDDESERFYAILQKQYAIWESACIEIPSLRLAYAKKNPELFQK
jgi:hypothetical protein